MPRIFWSFILLPRKERRTVHAESLKPLIPRKSRRIKICDATKFDKQTCGRCKATNESKELAIKDSAQGLYTLRFFHTGSCTARCVAAPQCDAMHMDNRRLTVKTVTATPHRVVRRRAFSSPLRRRDAPCRIRREKYSMLQHNASILRLCSVGTTVSLGGGRAGRSVSAPPPTVCLYGHGMHAPIGSAGRNLFELGSL